MIGSTIFDHDIAIVGMGGRFPGATNIEQLWQNLRNGVESISFFSDQELISAGIDPSVLTNPNYVKAQGVIQGIDLFDAPFFGYSPREVEIMDPQQRLFLECAWEAIESAGYNSETYHGRIGVYAGMSMNRYLEYIYSCRGLVESADGFQILIGNDKDFLPTRVSYKLNLTGPSVAVQTACSTSLVAVHLACQSLLSGECDMALAGGISIGISPKAGYLFQEGGIASPDGHCRAFDAQARGTVGGQGVGIVILKRLADALADGDCIRAVIKGSAINNDGSLKVGYTAPSVEGQAEVIAEALAVAGIDARTITYIETHGTGTAVGDPIEIAALTQAFRLGTEEKDFCAIGSIKTNIGHLDAAAGAAGLIKTVLALEHKALPPSLHFEQPNPLIDFANSPFYVNTTLSEWKEEANPRRAGVSSFGIGGTNAHIILEEAPPTYAMKTSRPWHLLTLSAKNDSALEAATDNLAAYLAQHPDMDLADVAYTLQIGRQAFDHRRVVICHDLHDAVNALRTLDPTRIFSSYQEQKKRSIVFMFPGQGAQYVRMAAELYRMEPAFRESIDLCSKLLTLDLGFDLRTVLYPSDNQIEERGEQLKQTWIAQPALFVIEYALATLYMSWGVQPQAMIGHSIGEYAAACLSGVFCLEDALTLVAARGHLMQELPGGAMLTVSLNEHDVFPFLGEHLSLAAVNGPALCVVSGPVEAIEALQQELAAQGIACRPLYTSHAFHSTMMDPIIESFANHVKKITLHTPRIPFVSNITGTWITATDATDPGYWAAHLRQTVRFADGLQELSKESGRVLLEVGPGQVLSTLARQQIESKNRQVVFSSTRHPQDQQSDVLFLLSTVGRLWLTGTQIDWPAYYINERRHRLPLPTYPFERQCYWAQPQEQAHDANNQYVSLRKRPDRADWFYIPSWKRIMPLKLLGQGELTLEKTRWLVFADECGIGSQLVERLNQKGQDVVTVRVGIQYAVLGDRSYTIRPKHQVDYDTLLEELRTQNRIPDRIVHLWNVTPQGQVPSNSEHFEVLQEHGFYSVLSFMQALSKQNATDSRRIEIISSNVQEVTGEEILCPEKATILGLSKVIPQEYSNITCHSIDIEIAEPKTRQERKLIDQLIVELTAPTSDSVIAYRGNYRWVQTFEPMLLDKAVKMRPRLKDKGVYLITGGLGSIGLVLAEHLARTVQAKLILIGRSSLPDRPDWQRWLMTHDDDDHVSRKIRQVQVLEELGAEVLLIEADVANIEQMQAAVARGDELFGTINGVIHAAGIVGIRSTNSIQATRSDDCEQQFRPKVHGLFVLNSVLQGRALDFCLLQSSLSSVLGGLGFAAYAAANTFMDAFAHKHNRDDTTLWISVNWDGWQLRAVREDSATTGSTVAELAMTSAEGIEAFQYVLSMSAVSQVVVSTGDLQARINQWVKLQPLQETEQVRTRSPALLHSRPHVQNAYVAPQNEIEQAIATIWRELLGINQIGIHDNFFELGGHSLVAVQLFSRLREAFLVELPLRSIFEKPTIAQLAEVAEETFVEHLEGLSDDEIQRLLSTGFHHS